MLAVIYARYSDSKQREESIEGQLKVCHEYAQANGFSVIHEYADRAKTGRSDDRYQFQKMLKDTLMPRASASRTITSPGSETQGIPASLHRAQFSPASMRRRIPSPFCRACS